MIAELTNRILDDLQADFERQSGHLTWDDVHQVVLGRSLSASDAVQVWREAATRFSLAATPDPAESSQGGNGEGLLTPTEERVLSRRAAVARLAAEADLLSPLPTDLKRVICGMGKAASDRLVQSNTGLVGMTAAEFAKRTTHLDFDDLFQEGILGLIHAIRKFDPDKGYRLTTYATWWIRQYIQRAIDSKERTIRLPSHMVSGLRELRKKRIRLRNSLGRPPTERELAHELGVSEGDVNLMLRVEQDAELLEDIPPSSGSAARGFARRGWGPAQPLDEIEWMELSHLIQKLLKCLDRRARFIILQRFELEGRSKYTLQELGDTLTLTRERVRQIEAKSLARLAQGKEAEALGNYLED
jgi:RNA polymerase primary sigma factor